MNAKKKIGSIKKLEFDFGKAIKSDVVIFFIKNFYNKI